MSDFALHPQLEADTTHVGELQLCRVLLMEDARYPWLILVPRLPDLKDLHEVPGEHQPTMWGEIMLVSAALEHATKPYKLNVAALGNMVSQLHVHIIARAEEDAAWPGPVWGVGTAEPYDTAARQNLIASVSRHLF